MLLKGEYSMKNNIFTVAIVTAILVVACNESGLQELGIGNNISYGVRPEIADKWVLECDYILDNIFSKDIRNITSIYGIYRDMNDDMNRKYRKETLTDEEKNDMNNMYINTKKVGEVENYLINEYKYKVSDIENNNKILSIGKGGKSIAYCMRMPLRADPHKTHHGRYVKTRDGKYISYTLWVGSADAKIKEYGKIDYRIVYQRIDPVFRKKYSYGDVGDQKKLEEIANNVVFAFKEVLQIYNLQPIKDADYHLAIEKRKEEIGVGEKVD